MLQWLFHKTVRVTQYAQGIGAAGRPNSKADQAVLKRLKRHGQKPLVIFDVGANHGEYIQLALTQLANRPKVVHAFEPSQTAFAELSRRFAGGTDVVLNNMALGNTAGRQTLYYDAAGSELSSLYPRRIEHHGIQMTGSELVQVETLDGYCAAHGIAHIDLLKLDVEGHELAVLQGGDEMFEHKKIAIVSFEFGGCNVDARTFVRDFFHFFATREMQLARITAFGGMDSIPHYEEGLEQFRTTCFVAFNKAL
jgi:FkbM family methyltransferase